MYLVPDVTERLAKNPNAIRLGTENMNIFVFNNFLGGKQCLHFIRGIDQHCVPSNLMENNDISVRSSSSFRFDPEDIAAARLVNQIDILTGVDSERGEPLQGHRYLVGGEFTTHLDTFDESRPYWHAERMSGQRTWTAMLYLNVPKSGGATLFPRVGARITPRIGKLVLWNNLTSRGEINENAAHAGERVLSGSKYIITRWYREHRYVPLN